MASAVRAGAAGLYSLEAACELNIGAGWLRRDDFARFVSTATSIADGDRACPTSNGSPYAGDEGDADLVESAERIAEVAGDTGAMLAASRRIRFSPLPQGKSPASRLLMTAR